jgi:hypothetical protein
MRMENDCNVSDDVLEQKGVGALRRACRRATPRTAAIWPGRSRE